MTAFPVVDGTGTEDDARRQGLEMKRLRERVANRVRRFGFTDAEADQVVDDILDAWNNFAFDEEKANGAKPETVLTGLITNRCKTAMRGLVRNRARDAQYAESRVAEAEDQSMRRDVPLCLDVQEALSHFSPLIRAVCEALANGLSQVEIRDRLDVNRYQLDEIIDTIRSRFAALGLHEWLEQ